MYLDLKKGMNRVRGWVNVKPMGLGGRVAGGVPIAQPSRSMVGGHGNTGCSSSKSMISSSAIRKDEKSRRIYSHK
jgi:hypothetical protein